MKNENGFVCTDLYRRGHQDIVCLLKVKVGVVPVEPCDIEPCFFFRANTETNELTVLNKGYRQSLKTPCYENVGSLRQSYFTYTYSLVTFISRNIQTSREI